jgi:hypothetical protein
VEDRILRCDGHGLNDEFRARVMVAELVREQSEHVQRIRVVRLYRENLPVCGFRLRRTSRLVVLDRKLKGLLDGHGGRLVQ